jgi:23S rRNA (uracil1939-C5)-methyltransferase
LNGGTADADTVAEIAELTITGLSHDGQGVGRHGGQVVFVPGLLPGETARVQLVARARRHWHGLCLERLTDSEHRRRSPCILAERCGGCSLQHLSYPAQLQSKQQHLLDAVQRIAHLDPAPLAPLGCERELGYRNRAVIPLERRSDGRLRAGFYSRASHSIVNMNRCPVLDPRLDGLIEPLKHDLEASAWPVDRHLEAGGGLRHLALRVGHHSGEILITLISSHAELPGLDALAHRWMERWPAVVGVVLNLQDRPSNTLFGPKSLSIAGRDWLNETFCGLQFCLAADTFFQVNTMQAERVPPLVLAALPQRPLQVVDAYCGVGAFSLPLAAAGHRVTGIEVHPGAVRLGRRNAQRNGLESKLRLLEGPVAEHLGAVLPNADAVLLDPPRKGLDGAVRQALLATRPAQLLYLSCDPATLARDLAALTAGGAYRLNSLQALDFFANTSHVEALAVLSSSAADGAAC